ncbi:hypothetical protein, partial [Bifidobacterium sp.]|uniref:hypothetical protein n=1 Tax=Bifidobacterium sp. TaxID=41200 RepID=UPI003D7EF16C
MSNFDTPTELNISNGLRGIYKASICVDRPGAVSLSLAAAQRVARTLPGREVGEWWWFENSRAYLYYFFI